jgi:hypothetical protein
MKIYLHKDSRLQQFIRNFELYETVEDLKALPDNTLQIIPILPDEDYFLDYVKSSQANIILENVFEGSNTFVRILDVAGLFKDVLDGRYATICSGEMPESVKNCNIQYMLYLTGLKNDHQQHIMFARHERPYTFLYLNNRVREHRVALVNELAQNQVLDQALWSHISSGKKLPSGYDMGREITHDNLVDWKQWEAGLMVPKQHFDTYFSVQAESAVKLPYSFLTEKTWKPIIGDHPFVTLSGLNHYRDLKKLGFETFDHVFGSNWQSIEPWQDRMKGMVESIIQVTGPNLHDIMFDDETRRQCRHNQRRFWRLWKEYPNTISNKVSVFIEEMYPEAETDKNRWRANSSYALEL